MRESKRLPVRGKTFGGCRTCERFFARRWRRQAALEEGLRAQEPLHRLLGLVPAQPLGLGRRQVQQEPEVKGSDASQERLRPVAITGLIALLIFVGTSEG